MKLEQAIFTSSDRGSMRGYQLVAKSPGVDRGLSQQLCAWSPSQVPSDDLSFWTINCFPLKNGTVAVTRTVMGGPEYSSRGGTQVVTLILLLQEDQFEAFDCDAIAVAKTAMLVGGLRLPLDVSSANLPRFSLPDRPIVGGAGEWEEEAEELMLDQVSELLNDAQRVAVVGFADPIGAVGNLIQRFSWQERKQLSFTTGLGPAVSRPFQTHFFPDVDSVRQRALDSQDIVCVRA